MTTVQKSTDPETKKLDPIVKYCTEHTIKQHPLQLELQKVTLEKVKDPIMLGSPEVLTIGEHFIKLIKGKRILDVGTYTGASALAWALATPEKAEIYTFDTDMKTYNEQGVPIIKKGEGLLEKIIPKEGPAVESLNTLIQEGKAGTFDFAFIDADKENYPAYYEKCVQLLKKGGVILIDNALKEGKVVNYDPSDKETKAIDEMNRMIFCDPQTLSFILNIGDGIHLAFKN